MNSSEKKTFSLSVIKKVKSYTADNHHDTSRIILCGELHDKRISQKLAAGYSGIQAINDFFGYIPVESSKLRNLLDKSLRHYINETYINAEDVLQSI